MRHSVPWYEQAGCLEPGGAEAMDLDKVTPATVVAARSICAACPVRMECLVEALKEERSFPSAWRLTMRGGLLPAERHKLAARIAANEAGGRRDHQRQDPQAVLDGAIAAGEAQWARETAKIRHVRPSRRRPLA